MRLDEEEFEECQTTEYRRDDLHDTIDESSEITKIDIRRIVPEFNIDVE